MKVLFLSETSELSLNGSAQVHRLRKLSAGLLAHGIETSFLALPDMLISRPGVLFPLNLPFAWSKIRDCDYVHAVGDAAYTAVLWKLSTGITVIHDVDADNLAEAQLHWDKRRSIGAAHYLLQVAFMNWISYRSKDYFITVSRPLKERLIREKGIPANRLYMVRNGVDTRLFRPSFGGTGKIFTVCYAGGFHLWQGIDNLLKAGMLLKKWPVKIKIIGFREQHKHLKTRITNILGDSVELVDRLSQPDLVKQLSAAHVLVIPRLPHPAVEIAFPTKFAEYISMGKPVIVTDVDETASMVRKYGCGLVSEPTPHALAQTIRQASRLTESELIKVGQNGRHLAETVFDWRVVCRNYANLLYQWYNEAR